MSDQDSRSRIPLKAVIFDLYGTLIDAPRGAIRPDPAADPLLREILQHGNWRAEKKILLPENVTASPSTAIHHAIKLHHLQSTHPYPEVDLREIWKSLLRLPDSIDAGQLVIELHSAWNPIVWIEGAREAVQRASRAGLVLGLLSNAQHDTLDAIHSLITSFHQDLVFLSFQHGMAKPSPLLFDRMRTRLVGLEIRPEEVLYVGNHLDQDIRPARHVGFQALLFRRYPDISGQPALDSQEILSDWHNFMPEQSS